MAQGNIFEGVSAGRGEVSPRHLQKSDPPVYSVFTILFLRWFQRGHYSPFRDNFSEGGCDVTFGKMVAYQNIGDSVLQ